MDWSRAVKTGIYITDTKNVMCLHFIHPLINGLTGRCLGCIIILHRLDFPVSYTAIGRHIYKQLKMCKQYAKEMATLQ